MAYILLKRVIITKVIIIRLAFANITDLSNYTKNESLPTVLANNTPNVFITNKTRITTSSSESEKSEMTPTNIHESKHFTMWYRVRHNYLICRLITHFQFQK